jgi:hypothetical protein
LSRLSWAVSHVDGASNLSGLGAGGVMNADRARLSSNIAEGAGFGRSSDDPTWIHLWRQDGVFQYKNTGSDGKSDEAVHGFLMEGSGDFRWVKVTRYSRTRVGLEE